MGEFFDNKVKLDEEVKLFREGKISNRFIKFFN